MLKTTVLQYLRASGPLTFECIHAKASRDLPAYMAEDSPMLARALNALIREGEIAIYSVGEEVSFTISGESTGPGMLALMQLFPSLWPLVEIAAREEWTPDDLLAKVKAGSLGSGAYFSALFIQTNLSSGLFPMRDAVSKWDSTHRKAWAIATARLAAV